MKAGKREGKESRVTLDNLLSMGFSEAHARDILEKIRQGEERSGTEKKACPQKSLTDMPVMDCQKDAS